MPSLNNNNSRIQGILKIFSEFWRQELPTFEAQIKDLYRPMGGENFAREAKAAWKESVELPNFWAFGTPRIHSSAKDVTLTILWHAYQATLDINIFDRMDDQLKDAEEHMLGIIRRYAQLPHILFTEMLTGVPSLLPEIQPAYDGVTVFSTVDGDGNPRFGDAAGNTLTGSGFSSADLYRDMFRILQKFQQFLDPKNQIIFDTGTAAINNMSVIIPVGLQQAFATVLYGENFRIDSLNNTSESNVLKGDFEVHVNPRLTTANKWYAVLRHSYWKPFVLRRQTEPRAFWGNVENSDRAREYNEETLYSDQRIGVAPFSPFTIIEVTI